MRVLVVSSYPPRHCGIGAYARDQAVRLRAAGDEVTVLSPPDGAGDEHENFLGGRAFLRAAREGGRFDSIVVHFQPALYYAPRRPISKVLTSLALLWLALRRKQLDVLVHEADPPALWRPDYAILRLAFGRAGRVSFHTEAERAALEHDYHVRARAALVPHLVAPARPVSRDEARRRLGIAAGGHVFLCAGFLQASKGFDRAVDAFAKVGGSKDGTRLYVVGSIREPTEETEAYVRALEARCLAVPGVSFSERFLSDEDFDLWVEAADTVVLPYRRAWSSAVLARAQALGTPAIASDVGGLAEQAGPNDIVCKGDDELRAALAGIRAGGASTPVASSSTPPPDTGRPVPRRKGREVLIATILLSVALAALAQLTLKHGMNQVTHDGASPLNLGNPVGTLRRVAGSVSVLAGLAIFVVSAAVWLIVLSKVSLSFAYPFASLTYVLILVFDRVVLHQPVSGLRYGGVALIIAGILLVSRTHQTA